MIRRYGVLRRSIDFIQNLDIQRYAAPGRSAGYLRQIWVIHALLAKLEVLHGIYGAPTYTAVFYRRRLRALVVQGLSTLYGLFRSDRHTCIMGRYAHV